MVTGVTVGPLLHSTLAAEERDADALQYPAIEAYARAVVAVAAQYEDAVLWPAGSSANRLLGAVTIVTGGALEVRTASTSVPGRKVLVVGTVGVSSLELETAARHARGMGAEHVHGCAIDAGTYGPIEGLDSFTMLDPDPSLP